MAEKILIPSRDELIRRYERDYTLRNPGAKIGPNTLPGVDARVLADHLLPIYAEAALLGGGADIDNLSGTELEDEAADLGLPRRLPAVGASGAVVVTTVAGGETILAGTACRDEQTGFRYVALLTNLYETGQQVPVVGVELGPDSDVAAGAVLKWVSPPPGLADTAIVVAQADGSGLSGGRSQELDDDLRRRIRAERSTPALAGNSADYRKAALLTPGISVQAAFTYPAILGPGTMGMAFTMFPSSRFGSRRPTALEIALVRANVIGKMPADDGLFMFTLLDDPIDIDLKVRWSRTAAGWSDILPWPLYHATQPYYVTVTSANALTAAIATAQATPVAPGAGTTLAFWDQTNETFVRKTVGAITAGNGAPGTPWLVTFTTANGASDEAYVPQLNDRPMPWSDSLADVLQPLADGLQLGPSDFLFSFDEGGLRQRRDPTGFEAYPYELTGRVLVGIYAVASVDDIQVASPALPRTAPTVNALASTATLTSLRKLRIYPL
jgi:uncharacterized phage protein gp47/JayE